MHIHTCTYTHMHIHTHAQISLVVSAGKSLVQIRSNVMVVSFGSIKNALEYQKKLKVPDFKCKSCLGGSRTTQDAVKVTLGEDELDMVPLFAILVICLETMHICAVSGRNSVSSFPFSLIQPSQRYVGMCFLMLSEVCYYMPVKHGL